MQTGAGGGRREGAAPTVLVCQRSSCYSRFKYDGAASAVTDKQSNKKQPEAARSRKQHSLPSSLLGCLSPSRVAPAASLCIASSAPPDVHFRSLVPSRRLHVAAAFVAASRLHSVRHHCFWAREVASFSVSTRQFWAFHVGQCFSSASNGWMASGSMHLRPPSLLLWPASLLRFRVVPSMELLLPLRWPWVGVTWVLWSAWGVSGCMQVHGAASPFASTAPAFPSVHLVRLCRRQQSTTVPRASSWELGRALPLCMVAVNGNNQPRNLSPSCHRASASAASCRVPPRPRRVAPSPPLPSASAVATPCGFASVGRAPPSIMCRALWAGKRRRERLKKRRGRKEGVWHSSPYLTGKDGGVGPGGGCMRPRGGSAGGHAPPPSPPSAQEGSMGQRAAPSCAVGARAGSILAAPVNYRSLDERSCKLMYSWLAGRQSLG